MFNVTVLKMRDIKKYLVGIIITIFVVIFTARYFSSLKNNDSSEKSKLQIKFQFASTNSLTKCLDKTVPTISYINEGNDKEKKENNIISNTNYLERFLQIEIASIKQLEEGDNNQSLKQENKEDTEESNQVVAQDVENKDDSEIQLAQTQNVKTEVITQNPISENYNSQYGKIKIKNQTTFTLTEEMLKPDIKIDNKNIIIFHTHSCESYTPSEKNQYATTGNYRTTDLNYTVTRVGTELEKYLKSYNLNVNHNTSYHDYPSYTGSYTRSLQTVEGVLKTTPSDIIIDLHRDAVGSRSDYAPTVKIGEDCAAQIMFVIGTNEGGLYHPNWNSNLKFAVKVQEKAEEMYPGLFKPIMLTKSRYNQHTGKYANIMEVGATGNTLEQCLTSMKYLSAVMNAVINE